MKIKLLHLYDDIMNLYGEYANIVILAEHLKDQGFEIIIDKKTIGDEKDFNQYDFIYMGSGTEKNQEVVLNDIKKDAESLKEFIENEKVALFTGNSYEILGKSINHLQGLNFLDFEVKNIEKRITEDIICTSFLLQNKLVGFINNMSRIENNNNPLFKIELGVGENETSNQEGIVYKNLYGTHLIGPLLIRNPGMLKYIIEKICKNKDKDFSYKDIEYTDEQQGYELVLKELEARKNAT